MKEKIAALTVALLIPCITASALSITLLPPNGAEMCSLAGAKNTVIYAVEGNEISLAGNCEGARVYLFVNKDYVANAVVKDPKLLDQGIPLEQNEGKFTAHVDKALLVKDNYPNRVFAVVSDGKTISGTPVMLITTGKTNPVKEDSGLQKTVSTMVYDKDALVNRAQLAGYLYDILKLKPMMEASLFSDADQIPYNLRSKVAAVAAEGLMVGEEGRFSPDDIVTQEILSIIIERVSGVKDYIPGEPQAPLTQEQAVTLLLENIRGGLYEK